ncbi:SDR family NAD(P)-dependent oxidoreductase [Bowmanella dokdonensis]|uniref:SDR family oxidoreductase n=1 Tax=Bowmanella dokdonensis TaxID=751969 RepID=A0A939DR41_9ALTE|nr:SDR family NAD(P)-dependent oxidoreductase [Bowmanella dokdonensis]MBN7826346.1 SDR family oxidoreductase [Bowmanella dokdonensis]
MNKLVVLTGASRGLGLAIAEQLLQQNYQVLAIARSQSEALKQLAQSCSERLDFMPADLGQLDALPDLCHAIIKQYGRPYALINNAAVGHDGVLATLHNSQISELLNLNLQAPILMSKYLLRSMLLNRAGRIVNISSIVAKTGFNGLSVYAASKAGLEGFSRSLAREAGKGGVTVNCVAPGYMETEMTSALKGEKLESVKRRSAIGRLATPEDAAAMVAYLLSEQASAITGTVMTVDGGSTA